MPEAVFNSIKLTMGIIHPSHEMNNKDNCLCSLNRGEEALNTILNRSVDADACLCCWSMPYICFPRHLPLSITVVLDPWVFTPLGVASQIPCISDIYIKIHNSRKITVVK